MEPNTTDTRASHGSLQLSEWVNIWDSLYKCQQKSEPCDRVSQRRSVILIDQTEHTTPDRNSTRHDARDSKFSEGAGDGFEDELEFDLAKAAVETGNTAYEAHDWTEAESLLQEAVKILQRLPNRRFSFFNIFDLHYKLAVCTYHTKENAIAEEALTSLIQRPTTTDAQLECVYDATHLLSQLYIRIGKLDRARVECETAFKARRRYLGKQNGATLESMALMAHIHALLNNRALAKSYLAMIPEDRRDITIRTVEKSLGADIERLDSPTFSNQRNPEASELAASGPPNNISSITVAQIADLALVKPLPYLDTGYSNLKGCKERLDMKYKLLSRNEILDRIGCYPRNQIEEAVCKGDHSLLTSLLNKRKKNAWRLKLRKHSRAERVTALHFAALFGEIGMARLLVSSGFNVNEIPYGYSTSITPLKFAIGARQVGLVSYLIESGARPSEPDTWSSLASQLLSRSWLMKTMSEAEREEVPTRIITILRILIESGWDVNAPYEPSGKTLLHQAVSFWTGSYKWDLTVRAVVSSFLCQCGANPLQADADGHTPYGKAAADGNHDLALILGRDPKRLNPQMEPVVFAELVG